jgi:two-component system, NtrC family, response regulator HydG
MLVVDDESDTCENMRDIFSELGFAVDVAHDGSRALDLVRQKHYDVALLDLKMPGMDGLELYRQIKRLRTSLVAILVTAYASEDTAQAAQDAGAWHVLSKPVDPSRLLQLVEEAMDQPLVMIVDDDPDLCASLWDLFRDNQFRACIAHSVEDVSARLQESDMQVALIDMRLPRGDGNEIYQLIRQTNPRARTVVITGYRSEMEQLVSKVLEAGADAVCYKPFDMQALLDTVKKLAT